jgi:trehalose 6-phosphate phosphatase
MDNTQGTASGTNAKRVEANSPEYLEPGSLARIAPLSSCAYFLDVNGTLLEIQLRPGDVAADATLLRLLTELASGAHGALALVSGLALVSPVLFRRPRSL